MPEGGDETIGRAPSTRERRGIHVAFPVVIAASLLLVELYRRLVIGYVPHDFAAYLAAAETFSRGLDPYGDAIFDSPFYRGYPYIYPPASLYPLLALAHLPSLGILALDAVARMAMFAFCLGRLRARLRLRRALSSLLLAGLFFTPFAFDYLTGNVEIYMFFGFVLLLDLAERRRFAAQLLGGIAIAWLLCTKPMWLIPAGAALVALRGWAVLAGVVAAVVGAAAASFADPGLAESWLERLAEVRDYYGAVNFLEHSFWLYGLAVGGWIAVGVWILKGRAVVGDAWIYACTSIVIWPRSDLYSYLIMVPVLLWFWRRLGGGKALCIALPIVAPVPILLTAYDRMVGLTTLFLWACLCTVLVARLLIADASRDGGQVP